MRIVIATPIYPPEIGGPATYTKALVGHLKDEHEITVVAYANNGQTLPGSRLVAIDKQKRLIIRLWLFLKAMLKEAKRADVLYVQNAMAAGLPTAIAGLVTRTPVVLKFVGDEAWERASQHKRTNKRLEDFLENPDGGMKITLMRLVQGWVLRRCAYVTTPSVYLGEAITTAYHLDPKRVVTNYNAIDLATDVPFETEKKAHQLVTTARLVPWKGIDGIITAVAKLQNTYPDIHLVVHGDGEERANLESLASSLGVSERITFTGNVSRVETYCTRRESEVYVLNSTYEGLPHTVLSCFIAEIPIVATDISGTDEAVYHEKTGLLVPPNDPDALASAIDRLFKDKDLQARLVAGGTALLDEKFSWPAHISTLSRLLNDAVSGN